MEAYAIEQTQTSQLSFAHHIDLSALSISMNNNRRIKGSIETAGLVYQRSKALLLQNKIKGQKGHARGLCSD